MFDVLPRSLFNGGNGGIQLSYRYDTALSLTICNGVQNHLAPKTLHSYFTLFKLLYASSIHTRSSSPHVTDHVSQLAQEDFVSEQKSQAVMHAVLLFAVLSLLPMVNDRLSSSCCVCFLKVASSISSLILLLHFAWRSRRL